MQAHINAMAIPKPLMKVGIIRERENSMKRKILYAITTAAIAVTAFSIGKFSAPAEPETVQPETIQTAPELTEMTVESNGLFLEYSDGNDFYSYWISSEKLADHDLINVNDIKGWETYNTGDIIGIELQASDWGYVIEKEPYTVDTTAWRTE